MNSICTTPACNLHGCIWHVASGEPTDHPVTCQLSTVTMHPEDLQLLLTREMPYGKYKGRVIADLPGHYLNWFAREGFPKGETGRLLALMHEIDHNGLSSLLEPLRR